MKPRAYRDPRSVQERWEAAQDTMDCITLHYGSPVCIGGCMRGTTLPDIEEEWRHRGVASMQLDGIDHRRLP